MNVERSTLEQLERQRWPEGSHVTGLAARCHALRKTPIGDLSIEDLRLLIDQGIGRQWLVPIALKQLAEDPLLEGDMYPGDLLVNVLKVGGDFWRREPELGKRAGLLSERANALLRSEEYGPVPLAALEEARQTFLREQGTAS